MRQIISPYAKGGLGGFIQSIPVENKAWKCVDKLPAESGKFYKLNLSTGLGNTVISLSTHFRIAHLHVSKKNSLL